MLGQGPPATSIDGTGVDILLRDAVEEVDLELLEDTVGKYVASLTKRQPRSSD